MILWIIGAFILITIYTLIPKRFSIIADASKINEYSRNENIILSFVISFISIFITILFGILFYGMGRNFMNKNIYVTELLIPAILIGVGVFYILLHVKGEMQHVSRINLGDIKGKAKGDVIKYLLQKEFLMPNFMLSAYYFPASFFAKKGFYILTIIFLIFEVIGTIILSDLIYKEKEWIKNNFISHHNEEIMGAVLITLGILFYYFGLD